MICFTSPRLQSRPADTNMALWRNMKNMAFRHNYNPMYRLSVHLKAKTLKEDSENRLPIAEYSTNALPGLQFCTEQTMMMLNLALQRAWSIAYM